MEFNQSGNCFDKPESITVPANLIDGLTPYGIWYYLRLRQFLDVGECAPISYRTLKVNRVSATKNNWLLERFGFIKVTRGEGCKQPNIYEILR